VRCAPTFTSVIGKDDFGEGPLLLREEDGLPGGDMRWSLVAQTDDGEMAAGVMERLVRRCHSRPPGATRLATGRLGGEGVADERGPRGTE
jgi:hypothetical protein